MKRLMAFMLAAFMLCAVVLLASCGETTEPTEPSNTEATTEGTKSTTADKTPDVTVDTGSTASTPGTAETQGTPATEDTGSTEPTEATTEATTSGGTTPGGDGDGYSAPEGYGHVTFGGRVINIVTTSDWADEVGRWCTENEVNVETRSGSPIEIAVYDRNKLMNQLYGCEIIATEGAVGTLIGDDIKTGKNTYDFGTGQYAPFATNKGGTYRNVYELALDYDLPGWNNNFIEQCTLVDKNGNLKRYAMDGDFNLVGYRATWTMFMNLDLYKAKFGDESSIFDIVARGEWTIDKMMEIMAAVQQENGDSVWTPGEDVYGLITTSHNLYGLITSTGMRFTQNVDHALVTSVELMSSGDIIAKINKCAEMYKLDYVKGDEGYVNTEKYMRAGKTLLIGECLDVLERMSDSDLNVTVIPEPLYEVDPNCNYMSYVNTKSSYFYASANAFGGNLNQTANFINLYCYHSNKLVFPAFLNTYGNLYCNNERASEMLSYVIGNRQYDYAYYNSAGVFGEVSNFINNDTANQFTRAVAKKFVPGTQEQIDNLLQNLTESI